jgi:hypothetical protein
MEGDNVDEDIEKIWKTEARKTWGYQVVNVTCADYTNHGRRN